MEVDSYLVLQLSNWYKTKIYIRAPTIYIEGLGPRTFIIRRECAEEFVKYDI